MKYSMIKAFYLYQNISTRANPDKLQFYLAILIIQRRCVCNETIENSRCDTLLGIKTDTKVKFDGN